MRNSLLCCAFGFSYFFATQTGDQTQQNIMVYCGDNIVRSSILRIPVNQNSTFSDVKDTVAVHTGDRGLLGAIFVSTSRCSQKKYLYVVELSFDQLQESAYNSKYTQLFYNTKNI